MSTFAGLRHLVAAVALAVSASGCAVGSTATPIATPIPTSCGGSHAWPPNEYAETPAGLTVEPVSGTTVRVANTTEQTWTIRVSAWGEGGCTGWLSFEPSVRADLAGGTNKEVTIANPNAGLPFRIGVEFWDHRCDDTCTDAPVGFGWVEEVTQPSPTRQIIPLDPVWFDSWQEAEDYVGWPLRRPTSLPAGIRLTALQAFIFDGAPTPPDSISATYTGEGGASIGFWQDRVIVPEAFSFERSIPNPPADIPLERIEMDGSLGYWMGGVALSNDAGNWIGWDHNVIVLEWQSGDVIYRFQGTDVELTELIDMARSLQAADSHRGEPDGH